MFEHNIGHLPIVDGERLVGIVTRNDYLNFRRGEQKKRAKAYKELGNMKREAAAEIPESSLQTIPEAPSEHEL